MSHIISRCLDSNQFRGDLPVVNLKKLRGMYVNLQHCKGHCLKWKHHTLVISSY